MAYKLPNAASVIPSNDDRRNDSCYPFAKFTVGGTREALCQTETDQTQED